MEFGLAPFTVFFSLLYGVFVDACFSFLKINVAKGEVKTAKLVTVMTLSTMLVGLISYYVTVHLMELMPRSLMIEIMTLVVGTLSGAVAGYLASFIWNKNFSTMLK